MYQWCYVHRIDETFPDEEKPVFCDECGHVYKSLKDVKKKHKGISRLLWKYEKKRLSLLWRGIFFPKNKILTCIFCSHPFRRKVP